MGLKRQVILTQPAEIKRQLMTMKVDELLFCSIWHFVYSHYQSEGLGEIGAVVIDDHKKETTVYCHACWREYKRTLKEKGE